MSDLPYKATLKSGGGYDAPWITVDGATAADLANNLDALVNSGAVQKVVQAASLFQGALTAGPLVTPEPQAPVQQQPAQQQWSQPQQQAAPAVPQVRLHPEGKTCSCGRTLEYKEVNRKSDGKTFKFWSCPAQQKKGDGHDTEFAD